ncbi:hypothetical protein LNP74_18260 [Klebsiella pneumoniae subsp. pneumoniae]|nr:hypothetical protein [Klebsiella pneumoniae subsp. pneumoniae]
MKMKLTALMSGMILSSSALCFSATAADKMVIAHRGASGYLPEHTPAGESDGLRSGGGLP